MSRKFNKKPYRKLNVRNQAARCKTSNFLENHEIIFALQSSMIKLQEWKMLKKTFSPDEKIGALLVNSKLANKFVVFNETKTNSNNKSLEPLRNLTLNQKLTINVDPEILASLASREDSFVFKENKEFNLLTQSNKDLKKKAQIKFFQAPTLLIGCQSQEQLFKILESIININSFLLPLDSPIIFSSLNTKLGFLPNNRILLGGIYKSIEYSHLDFSLQNNIKETAYPNFRDSLQKKISLVLSVLFLFFQQKMVSTIPHETSILN